VTTRKKKILLIQIIIFILAVVLLFFTYSSKDLDEVEIESIKDIAKSNNSNENNNTFEDVEYKGIDFSGNRYTVKSKIGSFEIDTPEQVNMEIMTLIFYFKDGRVLTVNSDKGKYNNKTLNIEMRDNIVGQLEKNYLYGDNLDYISNKNLISVYGNVKSESENGNVAADLIELDMEKETMNISMFGDKKVNVIMKK
jgi:LPS export ABC transporter protein LptC